MAVTKSYANVTATVTSTSQLPYDFWFRSTIHYLRLLTMQPADAAVKII